ncbi:NAD(P)H-hydrate dehydratase [Aggregatilineales bacterium SYSU G02658]
MLKIATEAQIRAAEQEANDAGLSYDDMMQRAGRAVADRALEWIADVDKPQVTALIGPGNNGGDGVLAALFIAQDQPDALVRLYLLRDRPDDPYLEIAKQAGLFIALAENDADKRLLRNMAASSDLIIDALFGLGVRLPLRGEAQHVLRAVRQAISERRSAQPEQFTYQPTDLGGLPHTPPIRVIAVDLPSGVEADTGKADSLTLAADETVSFITARRGHFTGDAVNLIGKLSLANLGFSAKQKTLAALPDSLLDADYVRYALPKRAPNSHKGTFGHALIVGGSDAYYGAPLLAALGCYGVGTGLVTLAAPPAHAAALAGHLPEAIWMNPESSTFVENIATMDAALIGPGLGQSPRAAKLLEQCMAARPQPWVIDADALNLLAQRSNWAQTLPSGCVLTPHPAEMGRLAGISTAEVQADRFEVARQHAQQWGHLVVLKGAHTIIALPDGTLYVSPFKTSALAKAGTGDVLAGMIVGLAAQGLTLKDAALVGCYLHGAAGAHHETTNSSRTLQAHDLSRLLGNVFRSLERR